MAAADSWGQQGQAWGWKGGGKAAGPRDASRL